MLEILTTFTKEELISLPKSWEEYKVLNQKLLVAYLGR